MNEGHDDATTAKGTGGNNSAEQFQPESQTSGLNISVSAQPTDTAPQGIFSSGELAVNSENLEEIKPTLSEENKSRIASAFGKTEATQKQDQLSEQMASQDAISGTVIPANTATTSTATGDIRLSGVKKKSKLPLILLALVVAAAAVGVVVWGMMRNSSSSTQTPSLNETEKSFAKYATYLLYGEEKDVLDGEYDNNKNYAIDQQLEDTTYNQEYWDKAETLLKTSFATLRQSDNTDKEVLLNTMENYQTTFDFLKTYKRIGNIDDEALLAAYISNGMSGVDTLLDNYYSAFYSLDNETATTYADQRKQQYRDIAGIYAVYRELGCIVNGLLDEETCRSVNPPPEIQERLAQASLAVSQDTRLADMMIENASHYLASYCWDLYGWLKNPAQLKEGGNE